MHLRHSVNSRSFPWVVDAFAHAQAFMDGLGDQEDSDGDGDADKEVHAGGAPATGGAIASASRTKPTTDHHPSRDAVAITEHVQSPGSGAEDTLGGDDASGDVDTSSEEDTDAPSRFPSRSTSGARSASGDEWQPGTTAWVPETVLKRKRVEGVTMWLIKWRYVVEPSWEVEDDLVDEGHGKLLEQFTSNAAAVAKGKVWRRHCFQHLLRREKDIMLIGM